MANSADGVRQDKVRRFIADLETTVGTWPFDTSSPSGSELIFPARGESRLAPIDAELIDNSEALDGYAGAISGTRGAVGMGGRLVTEVRAQAVTNVFPVFVKQLLASGMEASAYSNPTLTLIPSTKAITNWPGETGGTRSPASMSIAECLIDNNTADEVVALRGGVLATKIIADANGLLLIDSTATGQTVGSDFLDTSVTDLSGFGGEPSGQGKDPIVVKGATLTVNYVDDSGSTSITPARFRRFEIDLRPTIVRIEDPTETDGYKTSAVFYDNSIGVSLEFADASAYAGSIMDGFYSGRGWLDVNLALTLDSSFTVDQTLTIDVPRIQYSAERSNGDGARMFTFEGSAVRAERGTSTAPVTITWVHGTA